MNRDKKLQKCVYYVCNGIMPLPNEFNLERKQKHNCDIQNPGRWKRDRSENYNRKQNQWHGNGDTKENLAVHKKYAKKINNHKVKNFETIGYNQDFLKGSMKRKRKIIAKSAGYLNQGAQFIDSQKCSRNNGKTKKKKNVNGIGMSKFNNLKLQQTITNENSFRDKTPPQARFSKCNKHGNKNKCRYRKKICSTPQHLQNHIEEKDKNYSVVFMTNPENIRPLYQECVTLTAANDKSDSKYMRNNKVNDTRSQKSKSEVRNVNAKPLLNKHPNKDVCLNTFPCKISNLLRPASTIKFVINKYNITEICPSIAKEEICCQNKFKNNVMCYFVGLKSNNMQGVCLEWPSKQNEVNKKNKLHNNEQKHESNSITKCLNGEKSKCNTNFHNSPYVRKKIIKNNIIMVTWTRVRNFFKPGKISKKSLTDNCNEFSMTNKLNLNCRCDNTQIDTNSATKKCIKLKKPLPSHSKLSNLCKCSNPELSLSIMHVLRNFFRFKKKIATDDQKLDEPLFEIKIDSITKRVINKSEVKNKLMLLIKYKKESHTKVQECLKSVSDLNANSKIKGKAILNKISPSPSNCKGPLFELKLDCNAMKILNLPEIESKIRKMSFKYPAKVVDLLDKNIGDENNHALSGSDSKYLRDIRSKISCLWTRFLCKSENYMSQNKNEFQLNRTHPFLPKYDKANKNTKNTCECCYIKTDIISSDKNTRAINSCKRVIKNNSKSTKVNGKNKHESNHKIITKWFCDKVKNKLINLNKDNKQDGTFNKTTKKDLGMMRGFTTSKKNHKSNNKTKPSKLSKSWNNEDNKVSKAKTISKKTRKSWYSFKANDGLKQNKSRRHYQKRKKKGGPQMFNIFSKASKTASINKKSQSHTNNIYKTCLPKTNMSKKEVVLKQRKLRKKKKRKMRRDQMSYGCRYAHLKRTKKPCLWLYIVCPSLYPNYLLIMSCIRNLAHYMLILLAIVLWSPCIVVFEIFRACCCFVN